MSFKSREKKRRARAGIANGRRQTPGALVADDRQPQVLLQRLGRTLQEGDERSSTATARR